MIQSSYFRQRFLQSNRNGKRTQQGNNTLPILVYRKGALNSIKLEAIYDCRKNFMEKHYYIKLCLLSGYSNINGNEVADELARGRSQSTDPLIEAPICYYIS